MAYAERRKLIEKIETIRGSTVICFLTSIRPNVPSVISEDCVRAIHDHLLLLPTRPVKKIDLFLCSNGGVGTVSWRIVALLREFAEHFSVLIPYRAYSAATMIALGADEIVMHPFGELGPIDPTVSNDFNPIEGNRRIGISVEDVTAYVSFIKNTVGITHEDELIQAVKVLAEKVHPLALGNVERFLSQSRMIARKILRTHMKEDEEHIINEIVENMASKLYFHGHAINRREAVMDLHLKVTKDLSPELETTMWELYRDFEDDFKNLEVFNPAGDLAAMSNPAPMMPVIAAPPPPAMTPATPTAVPPPSEQPAVPVPVKSPPTEITALPMMAQGMMQPLSPEMMAMMAQQQPKQREYELVHVIIESGPLSSRFSTTRRYTEINVPGPMPQTMVKEEALAQSWTQQLAAAETSVVPNQLKGQSPADAQPAAKSARAKRTQPNQRRQK